jgi:hypothetical protein
MITPIQPINPQVNRYTALQPLVAAVIDINNNLPKTSLPTEVPGTLQSNTRSIPAVTLYNQYGVIVKNTNPSNLLARA